MADLPDVDDLRLVAAIADSGSVGAAARSLGISQPSASQRLSRLERRVGVRLFDRDTQGARATVAGAELADQSRHILGHLERAYDAARAAGHARRLRFGTFPSIAEAVFPVLSVFCAAEPRLEVEEVADHGPLLLEWLAEGTLDAAVVAIVDQVEMPAGLRAHRIGTDELVLLLPRGVSIGVSRRHPLRGTTVEYATYDASQLAVHRSLTNLGASPHRAATVPTALATARLRGCPALVPRSAVGAARPGELTVEPPFRNRLALSLVLPRAADDRLTGLVPVLKERLLLT
jgi:molybdate transport repressor ModE-like protein